MVWKKILKLCVQVKTVQKCLRILKLNGKVSVIFLFVLVLSRSHGTRICEREILLKDCRTTLYTLVLTL